MSNAVQPVSLRELKIKAGVVKRSVVRTLRHGHAVASVAETPSVCPACHTCSAARRSTSKELASYGKEAEMQQARIDKLVAASADDADIRKQREVLAETTSIIPDTKRRLQAAHNDLASALLSFKDDTSEDVEAARAIIEETKALVA
ncbi:hypothetical protein HK105_200103 [Polyrhizophydium stewartii]|uniref:Tubulin-specific chaperone A n=1 Tax=Polyrhizophydium stewartii TaxID=2732419 RepID=A0ABR4NKI8_9FUNG